MRIQYPILVETESKLLLSKNRVFSLIRMIAKCTLKKMHNKEGKIEATYYSPKVDVRNIFPHMSKESSFEYSCVITNHWASAEVRSWDPYEITTGSIYTLSTEKYKRGSDEYAIIVHIFMKHLADSGRELTY